MKRQAARALADWSAEELKRELVAAKTPPPIPAGWFTMHQLAERLSASPATAHRLVAANLKAGRMLSAKHPVRYANGVVKPTYIYKLA